MNALTLLATLLASDANASAETAEAEAPVELQRVVVGLYITAFPELSIKDGTFTVDMYLWMRHRGGEDYEAFELTNGEIQFKEESDRKVIDGETYVCWRIKALLRTEFSLHQYPFDVQRLQIHLEHPFLETDALLYEGDRASYERSRVKENNWGLRADVRLPEYSIRRTRWFAETSVYNTDFGDPSREQTASRYSRLVFEVQAARVFWGYVYKTLVPLLVILAMAYLVFFVPPNEVQTSAGMAMSALLSCVALNLAGAQNLPEIGYLVATDKFFICTYILIFVTLAEAVGTYGLDHRGRTADAERIEQMFRWIFPAAASVVFFYLGLAAYLAD